MTTKLPINIKENKEELEKLLTTVKREGEKKRIRLLLLVKDSEHVTHRELASMLNVNINSISRWLKKYKQGGLKKMLSMYEGNYLEVVTPFIFEKIKERLADPERPLFSYNHAVKWLKEEYNFDIEYQTLLSYMHRHFDIQTTYFHVSPKEKRKDPTLPTKKIFITPTSK